MNERKIEKICKTACLLSFCTFISSLIIQLHISNSTALKGKDFQELYNKKETLEKEIAYLKFEDSNLSSLAYIETRAGELGFVLLEVPLASISSPALAALNTR